MTKKILMGASFLALLAAFPALAETNVKTEASAQTSVGSTLGNTIDKVSDKVATTAEKAKEATKETYQDVKGYFSDDDDLTAMTSVNIMSRLTADELIGADVKNPQGKTVGKVDDILVNADGDAERVIVADGGVMGLGGKLVSVDYDDLDKVSGKGDAVVTLSEKDVKSAAAFDYDANIPAGTFRVSKIVGSKIVDTNGKNVAKVDTIAFEDDEADYAIVTFDKILGMGGDKAALDFDAMELIDNKGSYSFRLNAQQSAQFENYKQTTKTN